MDTIKLPVQQREEKGNGPARRLRAQGMVPGVTYSKHKAGTAIAIKLEDLKAAMAHGHNVVLELDFGESSKSGKSRFAVVKEMQFHPVKRKLLHVDLHEVDLTQEIESPVPVEAVGTAAGLADGGILDWERREVMVRARPGDMPAALEVDVSELVIGHNLTVAALQAPEGVAVVEDEEAVLVAMLAPKIEEEPVVEEEELEEGEEPELVGEEGAEEQEKEEEPSS